MATRQVAKWGPFKGIADGVRVGSTIYLSGAVSVDEAGAPVHPGDIVAQARRAYANIGRTLRELGASPSDVVFEGVFVTDMSAVMGDKEKMRAFFGVSAEFYGDNATNVARCLIQVAGLAFFELMIEIKVIAVV